MANTGAPQPTPKDIALTVWLESVAEVVAAILTRRAQSRDDGGQKRQEERHEDS